MKWKKIITDPPIDQIRIIVYRFAKPPEIVVCGGFSHILKNNESYEMLFRTEYGWESEEYEEYHLVFKTNEELSKEYDIWMGIEKPSIPKELIG